MLSHVATKKITENLSKYKGSIKNINFDNYGDCLDETCRGWKFFFQCFQETWSLETVMRSTKQSVYANLMMTMGNIIMPLKVSRGEKSFI